MLKNYGHIWKKSLLIKKEGIFFLQNSLKNFAKHREQIGQNSASIRYWGKFADLDNLGHQLDIFANLVGWGVRFATNGGEGGQICNYPKKQMVFWRIHFLWVWSCSWLVVFKNLAQRGPLYFG